MRWLLFVLFKSLPNQFHSIWIDTSDGYRPTGWPKKVSHYQESSLNRIKNHNCGYISRQF